MLSTVLMYGVAYVLLQYNPNFSCSLSIISSYDRGHAMSIVYKGVLNGEKIMELFGGDVEKKIYLHGS